MKEQKDDTFLSRWLNNELSAKELEDFKKDPDYSIYERIRIGSDAISAPGFDEKALLEKIEQRKQFENPQKGFFTPWYYGIAASIALLIGLFIILNWQTTQSAGYGERVAFNLPDESQVILNANSTASYQQRSWDRNREVELRGEAFFKVEKGERFSVETVSGTVTVLGTQFNVTSRDDLFEVTCFEGSVSVSYADETQEEILSPGDVFRQIDGEVVAVEMAEASEPSWITGKSTFQKMPLRFVLTSLANQYDITIEGNNDSYNQLFSGTFPHDDLEVALRVVLGSLEIQYTIEGQKVILRSN